MAARSKARKRAVNILYEADQRNLSAAQVLDIRLADPGVPSALPQYAVDLVEGVILHRERIDEILETYSRGWPLRRMPAVDRAILRLGTWELLYNDDVPDIVAIDEAVDLARELSTEDSPSFVNGLLGRVMDIKPVLSE